MRMIKSWNPSLMVAIEVKVNHNSASFGCRFIEALLFYSVMFDCVVTCIGEDTELREKAEEVLWDGIENMVVSEQEEREAGGLEGVFQQVQNGRATDE